MTEARFCQDIVYFEQVWLWKPVTTWDIAQAVLLGYAQVTEDPNLPRGGFSEAFANSLYTAAQARVASLFDPVTHAYLGPPPPPPTVKAFKKTYAPKVSGKAVVGKTLTAKVKAWSPKTTSKTWQWQRNGADIPGATGSKYKLVAADLGNAITVKVAGSRADYNTTTRTSRHTKKVKAGTLKKGTIKITGTPQVGLTLTAKTYKWSSGVTFTYLWYRNNTRITEAAGSSYVLTALDQGKRLKVKVIATKPGYKAMASTSKPTGKIR